MLISFIVPVYNGDKYIEACVTSLLDQGLENGSFEIILVNDGSTDHSEEVCQALAKRVSCIRVITQRNKGLSEARNTGIRAAQGDYLCHVDVDDTLVSGGIAKLTSFCMCGWDLIRYWSLMLYPGDVPKIGNDTGEVLFEGTGKDFIRQNGLETFCWNYLYKKSFVESNGLYFTPGIIGEDFPYMFDVMMADPKIVSVARRIHFYHINPGSISTTRTPENSRRWVNDLTGTITRIAGQVHNFKESDPVLYKKCLGSLSSKITILLSRILTSSYSVKEFRSIISSIKGGGILKQKLAPCAFIDRVSYSVLRLLALFPFLYPIASKVYR
jgi:glycosyltransferase involved in cell wall biosynthesis